MSPLRRTLLNENTDKIQYKNFDVKITLISFSTLISLEDANNKQTCLIRLNTEKAFFFKVIKETNP